MPRFNSLYLIVIFALSVLIIVHCSKKSSDPAGDGTPPDVNDLLVDSLATDETVALFTNLRTVSETKVLFGHQDDLAYGIGWVAEAGRSDVKEVCGDYPAVYGWDLGDIQNEANLDGVNFTPTSGSPSS